MFGCFSESVWGSLWGVGKKGEKIDANMSKIPYYLSAGQELSVYCIDNSEREEAS